MEKDPLFCSLLKLPEVNPHHLWQVLLFGLLQIISGSTLEYVAVLKVPFLLERNNLCYKNSVLISVSW